MKLLARILPRPVKLLSGIGLRAGWSRGRTPDGDAPSAAGPRPVSGGRLRRIRLAAERRTRGGRVGMVTSRFSGPGAEAAGVRPYQTGDPARSVDWRVTARRDELHIRSWHAELELPVIVAVDPGDLAGTAAADPDGVARTAAGTALEAAWWLLSAAAATGHPVGTIVLAPDAPRWRSPSRGRGHLRQLYRSVGDVVAPSRPGAGRRPGSPPADPPPPAPAPVRLLEELSRLHPGEALVLLVSPFHVGPDGAAELRRACIRAVRRHQLVPVWVETRDDLPARGLFRARSAAGRPFLVDGGSARVRARFRAARSAWREGVRSSLEGAGAPPLVLSPDHPVEPTLARYFLRSSRRGRPRSGPGRVRRAVAPGLVGALMAGLLAVPGAAQVGAAGDTPAGASPVPAARMRILSDTLLAPPVLGREVERVVRIRTGAGYTPAAPGPSEGEVWDVRSASVRALAGDTLWELRQSLLPWWMGAQRLPDLALTSEAGLGLRLQSRRVEVAPPPPPVADLAPEAITPSWPELPAAPWYGALVHLPAGLLAGAVASWALSLRGRHAEPGEPRVPAVDRRTRDPGPRPSRGSLEGRAPRESLDLAMALVRRHLHARCQVDTTGWTPSRWRRWVRGESAPPGADALERVVEAADEPRFAPDGALPERVATALDALEELGLIRPGADEVGA